MFAVELYLKNRNYLDIKVKLLKLIKQILYIFLFPKQPPKAVFISQLNNNPLII